MIVLDATVLIGYLDAEDAQHSAAHALLTATISASLHRRWQDLDVVEVAFPADAAFRLAEIRVATGVKMPGCCVLLTAASSAGTVASFDTRLLQAAERQGLRTLTAPSE